MVLKALELGMPETMLEMFKNHAELLFHPSEALTKRYLDFFLNKDYNSLKAFFEAVRGNHLLVKPSNLHTQLIERAAKENDKETL